MKSTIMKLKEKTKMWLSPKHEFSEKSLEFRQYYACAILMQTQLSEAVTPMDHFELLRLFGFGLHLGKEEVKNVILMSKNKENVLENILKMLDNEKKQTVFLLDLYNVSYNGREFGPKELEAVNIYGELFQFTKPKMALLQRIIQTAIDHDKDECMKCFSNMMLLHMACSLENIRYYIPELEYTTVIDSTAFYPGKRVKINGQCEIREQIKVPQGCSLLIHNAQVKCHAPIIISGGKVEIINSELEYVDGIFNTMLTFMDDADVVIKNSQFYCRNYCSAILQNNGNLSIYDSSFYETNGTSAVEFNGINAQIIRCGFFDCYTEECGAAIQIQKGEGVLDKCHFHYCLADRGGAICVTEPVKIVECIFFKCHARYMGNAIYYKGMAQRYVSKNIYEHVLDDRDEIVQEITDVKEIENAGELKMSTYLVDIPEFSCNKRIYIHDAHLFLGNTIRILGGLLLEHCIVTAYRLIGDDMFDITNASPVEIVDCTFDGAGQYGIICATGTKLSITSSVIKNTNNGRAIYNSVDLYCDDCIFSNCLGGGIFGSRALIKSTVFLNCRSDRGAGCYLAGNKGLIKNCTFERCVALVNGGGITTFGNYQVVDTKYIECEPDNQS